MKSLKFEIKICPNGKILSDFVPNNLELKYFCIKIATKKKFQKDKIPPKKIQRKKVLCPNVQRLTSKRRARSRISKKIIFWIAGLAIFFLMYSSSVWSAFIYCPFFLFSSSYSIFSSSRRFCSRCIYCASM